MIPELIAYYIFNIYSCIAAVVVGGTTTAVVVIKLYYPRYDVFYISSQSRKGVEDHSDKSTANRTRVKCTSLQLYPNWSKIQELWRLPKRPRLTYGYQGYLYNRVAGMKMAKHIESKRTTAVSVIKAHPADHADSSLLVACVLPGLFLLVFILIVIIQCRRAKKPRVCVKVAMVNVTGIHSRKTADIECKLFKSMVLEKMHQRNPVPTGKEIVPWVPQLTLPKDTQSDNKIAESKKEVPKKVVYREEHQRNSVVDQESSKGKEIVPWVPHLELLKVPKSSSSQKVALDKTKPKALPSLDAAHDKVDRGTSCKGKEIVPVLLKAIIKRDLVLDSDTNNIKKTMACETSLKNRVEQESYKEKENALINQSLRATKPQKHLIPDKGKIADIKRKPLVKKTKYKAPKKISADTSLPDKPRPGAYTNTIKRASVTRKTSSIMKKSTEAVKTKKVVNSVASEATASATRSAHSVGTEDTHISTDVPLPSIQPADDSKGQSEPIKGEFLLPLRRPDDDFEQKRDKRKIRSKKRNNEKSPSGLETNLHCTEHSSSRRFKPLILKSNNNNVESLSSKRQQISRTAKKNKGNKSKGTTKLRDDDVSCSDQSMRSQFSIHSDKDFPSLSNSLSPEENQRKELNLKVSVDQESCKLGKEIVPWVSRPVLLKAKQTESSSAQKVAVKQTPQSKASLEDSLTNLVPENLLKSADASIITIQTSSITNNSDAVKIKEIFKSVGHKATASATRSGHSIGTESIHINADVPLPSIQPGDNSKTQSEPIYGEFLLPLRRPDDDFEKKRDDKKKAKKKKQRKGKTAATLDPNLQWPDDSRKFKPVLLKSENNLGKLSSKRQISKTSKNTQGNKNRNCKLLNDVSGSVHQSRSPFSLDSEADFPSLANIKV